MQGGDQNEGHKQSSRKQHFQLRNLLFLYTLNIFPCWHDIWPYTGFFLKLSIISLYALYGVKLQIFGFGVQGVNKAIIYTLTWYKGLCCTAHWVSMLSLLSAILPLLEQAGWFRATSNYAMRKKRRNCLFPNSCSKTIPSTMKNNSGSISLYLQELK